MGSVNTDYHGDHIRGWCECGYYHKEDQVPNKLKDVWGGRMGAPSSVTSLIEDRDPITGKLKERVLTPQQINELIFTEGKAAWDEMTEEEQSLFFAFIQERFKQAHKSHVTYATRFFGDMLINLKRGNAPVHGEYVVSD